MVGVNHSFFKLLKDDVPHAMLLRCICHSAALVASSACAVLPRTPEDVLRGIYNYVSGSAKRSAQLQELQEFFKAEEHKILKIATTRWLARHQCVVRVLEQWNVLENYFQIAVHEDGLKSAEFILFELKNIYTKGYFTFLKYILHIFNSFNALFQSRKVLIHTLYSETEKLLRQLCRNYLDSATVLQKDLLKINLAHPGYFKSKENITVGPECQELLMKMPAEGRDLFLTNVQKFYVTAGVDLQKRLPNSMFKVFEFLDPNIAFADDSSARKVDFSSLCERFQTCTPIDKTDIAIEWELLPDSFSKAEISSFKNKAVDELWLEVAKKKKFDDSLAFPNLSKLVKLVLVLPHSNAEAERIFSIVSDTKTKKRNRLGHEALNAVCVTRSSLQANNQNSVSYCITPKHIDLHNTMMYSFKNNSI